MDDDFAADLALVDRIQAIPTILQVVCQTTGMGFAAVARVTDSRWIACSVLDRIGFGVEPGSELKVETTLCHEVRHAGEAIVIDRVAADEVYREHATPAMYGFQSYISTPIVLSDGAIFGTLCAIDPRPARVQTPEVIGMFKLFAELIAFHLEAQSQLASSEANLLDERKTSELREQFIAVLGHDLRNPLASIQGGAQLLLKRPLDDRSKTIVGMLQHSADRMGGLIDNVLDFARGRLGGGLILRRTADTLLAEVLEHVTDELRTAWPEHSLLTAFDLREPVSCDAGRISQLYSNLLANALVHGSADQPVRVEATAFEGVFRLSVANAGEPIAPGAFAKLFHPFSRGAVRPNQQGLGLGLYIAQEIARAHGGELSAVSTPEETRFTFTMATQPA